MNIYLIRHGDAEKASALKKDFDRTLTPEGEQKIKTAEIVAQVYKFTGKIITDKRLIFGNRTEELIDLANEVMGHDMAFIGHEPDFSEHVSNLISNSSAKIDFKKGMIAKISFSAKAKMSRGVLEFLIPSKAYK